MSAIFGLLRFDGRPVAPRDLERMGNALAHRGPDGRKSMALGQAGLGHCLMRVHEEDLFEAQPLHDAQAKLTLVADLRLDNREELAAALGVGADALRDMPDSGLLLRAYKMWGAGCAEHLLGDFAFAIWDAKRGTLVLGRDPMGQRAVLYHIGDGFIAFASEIKALWALADVPRRLLDDEIGRVLTRMTDRRAAGVTLYAGIRGVPGGTLLTVDGQGDTKEHRYWEPRADPAHEGRDDAYYIAAYRRILEEAVACRLRRLTRPAALMLSGGFDSAAIAGLAGPALSAGKRKLIALTQVVSEPYRGTAADITPYVEACARVMPHLDLRLLAPPQASPLTGLEKRFLANDGLAALDHQSTEQFFAAGAKAGTRVIMDGIGGDYTVNPRGYAALAWLVRHGHLRRFFAELGPFMRLSGQSLARTIGGAVLAPLLPAGLLAVGRRLLGGAASGPMAVNPVFLERLVADGTIGQERAMLAAPRTGMRALLLAALRRTSAAAVPGSAVAAASFGLELVRPFHDRRVAEFGLAVPERLYMKDGRNRYLACRALADVYPPEILTRGWYNDAASPEGAVLLNGVKDILAEEAGRLADNPGLAAYIDFGMARRVLMTGQAANQARAARAVLIARYIEWFRNENRR